ncbi:MAG: NAD(+) synthase [Clostridia bacterium]|nr:NAD(+) synthase [Clostridia bacterium]
MRDYAKETEKRVAFIKDLLAKTGAKGIVFGNSGGKDSALVGILCKKATENVLGVIMPCESKRNFTIDADDGREVAEKFNIATAVIDLTEAKRAELAAISSICEVTKEANVNIAPRLRMTALYAIGQSKGYLVAGTDNRSEIHMGYYTKWGDGAYDFNPISDLAVCEVYEFLEYLGAPESIIKKAPSAGLFEGQTDEQEMGVTYAAIDSYLLKGECDARDLEVIERYHRRSRHKREPIVTYESWASKQ